MIYIIQCLCPSRHCIFGAAYDPDELPAKEAGLDPHEVYMAMFQHQIEKWVAEKTINPWCGICNSRDWHYEARRTPWQTMEDAGPHLMQAELEQMLSRAVIDQRKAERN